YFIKHLGFDREIINTIERLIFLNYSLEMIRSWTNCNSSRSPSIPEIEYISCFLSQDSSYSIAQFLLEQNEFATSVQVWLANRGARSIPNITSIDINLFENISIFDDSIPQDLSKLLTFRAKEIRSLSLAYLSFVSFFMGAVCKADIFRTSILSRNLCVQESVDNIISLRDVNFFRNSIEILS
ncbi:hypothetical protein L1D59_24010, partial [Pseudoalteromonas piscicida]|uniref:hypothetical protein n=1 Tax=Pseudoalteromonas piscicida TaxID=43662 RepID=UPI001EFCC7B9